MSENAKPVKTSNMHAIVLFLLGIIAFIWGALTIGVRHFPLRGSGLGTVLVIVGVLLFVIGFLRLFYKKS